MSYLSDACNKAAIGFPIIILLLLPLRTLLIPRLPFTEEELRILDGPTASAFVSDFSFGLSQVLNNVARLWNLSEAYPKIKH
jgi:hypothetical protein